MMPSWRPIGWLLAGALAAAAPASAAEIQYPIGSSIGIAPPPGLTATVTPPGFRDAERDVTIVLLELPRQAYQQLESSMTTEAAKQQGITVEHRETVFTDAGAALVSAGEDSRDNTYKWMMIAQVPDFTALISVQIPKAARDRYPDATIRAALASLSVRKPPIDEQLGLLPYKIGNLAGFRVVTVLSRNTVILTSGPDDTLRAADQPRLIVGIAPSEATQPADRERVAQLAFNGLPGFVDRTVTAAEMLRIDGQPVYEIRADAREAATGTPVTLVQWLRFGQNAFVHILGVTAKANWSRDFPKFRAVRDGIEPRG